MGAIVSGLNLPSSKQHNELLQAWEASQAQSVATDSDTPTPNDSRPSNSHSGNSQSSNSQQNSLQAELSQPVTRGEVAALLYHALRLTDEGQNLADIALPQARSESIAQSSSYASSPVNDRVVADGPPIQSALPTLASPIGSAAIPGTTIATSTIATSTPETIPETIESPSLQPPLLVAAQLPLPDPLLSPLPPVPEDRVEAIGSDDFGLSPTSSGKSEVERVSPEFSAEALPLAPATSAETSIPDTSIPDTSIPETSPENGVDTAFSAPSPLDETYTLGAGDRVFIEVFGLPQYSQEYQVLVDGSLNLPRAGRMVVEGMTLTQAESLIFARYARYYQQPATSVVLVAPRSLRISVTGEVNRPGVYRISPSEGSAVPSLTQALQEAGGIRQDADLRQVKVYRSQRNGEPQELALNLWSLLQTGDLTQDISLRDGDRVIIPKAEAFNLEDLNQIATATARESLQLESAQKEIPWQLLVAPQTSDRPISPNVSRNLLSGILFGLALGVGTALLIDRLDNVFHSIDQVQEEIKDPLLGVIPFSADLAESPTHSRPKSAKAQEITKLLTEATRSLAINLRLMGADSPIRSLVVSSAMPGDGKSTVALNLAQAAAAMGQRVLLVDADLRRPQVHRRLSLFNGQGLANLITNTDLPLEDVVQASGLEEKLSIVTSGQRPPDPSRLLSSETMKRLNQKLLASFDLVIYDTPPLLGLSDASLLSNLCDGLILVVGLGQTDRGAFKRSLETIKTGRSPLLGVVANAVKQAPGYRYYDYYYSYRYHHYYHTLDTPEDGAS